MTTEPATLATVDAPPARPPGSMRYGAVEVVALVIVNGNTVMPSPPHTAACVMDDNGIVAITGPAHDLGSVRDAYLFSKLPDLLAAVDEVLGAGKSDAPMLALIDALNKLRGVREQMDPVYTEVRKPSAEQRLAEAREGYDPNQNPDTSNITQE